MQRLWVMPLAALAAAATIAAAPAGTAGRVSYGAHAASEPAPAGQLGQDGQSGPVAQAVPIGQRLLVGVKGTPHTWFVDEQGVLHWVGDSAALLKGLYAGREYTLNDPLDDALKRSLARPTEVTFAQLATFRRGDPWLSTSFLALDGAVYLARWEAFEDEPALLRVQSAADLEWFGVTAANYGALVLAREAWEKRSGRRVEDLERDELRPVAPPAPTPPPCLPVVEDVALDAETVTVRVRNACASAQRLGLSAVVYDVEGGRPLATTDATTWQAAPGETREVVLQGSSNRGTWALPLRNAAPADLQRPDSPVAAPDALLCVPVGPGPCLQTDPWLRQAVEVLLALDQGQRLLEGAADFGVVLRRRDMVDALGLYQPASRTISLDLSLDAYSDWERAVVLAHELQHAADHASGALLSGRTSGDCLAREEDAFRTEAKVWRQLWPAGLPEPRNRLQEEFNQSTLAALRTPLAMSQEVTELYRHECRVRP